MVAYLTKSNASEGFNQVIDFLNGSYIKYALTVNPTIYVSYIKQFWNTVAIKQVNDVTRLQALVDKKKLVVIEATIREGLQLDDAEGVDCLPNEEIFAKLACMGYEKPSTKLTFYKAFFSSQWKFLIHTILQSMSAKRTSWNEFSSAMASAVICLSTGRKFNFSKYIFDSLVRNVDSTSKFYMYPLFLQLLIRKQVGDLSNHTTKYASPALTQKRVDISEDTVMDDASNHGRIIDELDNDDVVALMDDKEEDTKEEEAKVVEDDQEDEPDEVQEPQVPAATITAAPAKVAATPSRRRKGVVIRDPEEELTTSSIISVKTKSKDKGKGIMVILNGDSLDPTRVIEGVVQPVAPTTAEQRLQKLISQLEILGESLSQEDINLKFLRSLPTEWRTHTLFWRNKTDLGEQSLDDLFNSLKIYEAEVKISSSASTSTQNIAFVSFPTTDTTNDPVIAVASVFAPSAKIHVSPLPNVDTLSNVFIYLFFASQSNSP
nr:hypothetical protein [Tanacetum cinerariifolium]